MKDNLKLIFKIKKTFNYRKYLSSPLSYAASDDVPLLFASLELPDLLPSADEYVWSSLGEVVIIGGWLSMYYIYTFKPKKGT